MPATRLLFCYDGSADAKLAVERAAATFGPRPAVVVTVGEGEAHSLAADGARLATAHGFAPVEPLALRPSQPPWEMLVNASAELGALAVVIGARGRSGVPSALLGSVADHVVHHAWRPTLVVRETAAETASGPAVIAYDGSEDAKSAIACAAELLGPRVVVVLSVWQHPHAALAQSWVGLTATPDLEELVGLAKEAAHTCAAEGVALAAAAGLHAEPLVRQANGPVWPAILEVADELDVHVIVVGSRGLSGIKTVMLGSVSDAVLHHTRRPTLVVRHGARIDHPHVPTTDTAIIG